MVRTLNNDLIGGRLRFFLENWKQITSDRSILQAISGFKIQFDEEVSSYKVHPINFNQSERIIMQEQIEKLITKGVITTSQHEIGETVSNVFLRRKKDGVKYRMILNLKPLNKFVEYHHFKMDSLETAKLMMKKDCYLASVDLSDAYFSVPIHTSHRKFLKFLFNGQLYEFTALPQGLACAPRLFTKILKPFYAKMRELGHQCMGYIDDSFVVADTVEECLDAVNDMILQFEKLGFVINKEKSILTPVHSLEFLGYKLDSKSMTVSLPSDKAERIVQMCRKLIAADESTIQFLSEVLGTMNAYCNGVEYGRLHCRSLEILKNVALKVNQGNFEGKVSLNSSCVKDCEWWIANAKTSVRHIIHNNPDVVIFTDASKGGDGHVGGWGAIRDTISTGGRWSFDEGKFDINVLESYAAYFGLKSLCADEHNVHVQIKSDNTCAVSYINQMGGTRSVHCNKVAREMWDWAMARNIWISATHVAGVDNPADKHSRIFHDTTEWKLNEAVFESLTERWGLPDVDLFASRLNHQVDRYVSWGPDPDAIHIDAFTMKWHGDLYFVNPPFSLLSRVVQKLQLDQSEAIIIAPSWKTQVWFSSLMKLLIDVPLLLPRAQKLLYLPYDPKKTHPLLPRLMACRVSGDVMKHKDFLNRQSMSSWHPGETVRKNNTNATLKDGLNFVVNGVSITCDRL